MKCSKCEFDNREEAKFCIECGERLQLKCPQCGRNLQILAKFCDECGQGLEELAEGEKTLPESEGERKLVTVIFSDLSGYTAMSERLDPEELKEIMSRIFGEIAQVVTKYEGFIEKFIGDAVVAFFGVPKAHEDDPIRGIKTAREINDLARAMSPQLEERIGQPLSMHTGINTGLVVTGEVDLEKGTHGITGDTINLASRLNNLAKAGEILVSLNTYRQAEGYFTFQRLQPVRVKGKTEPIQVYKVLSAKERPVTMHRLSGLKADLIGRKVEMAQLEEAIERLRKGKGTIFSVCGDAGTGKSRLVEELRATLDLDEIQWVEGHAYPHSQNVPYFPFIDLFNRAWQIQEGDTPGKVRMKIELNIERCAGKREEITPYIGSLYALSYPEIKGVSPEFWKLRLQEAVLAILSALTKRTLTVMCLEDIHWADPSSIDLLRSILSEFRGPALFLCVYRPPFSLFASHQLTSLGKQYREIQLRDFSPSEAEDMVESLLKTEILPQELRHFIREKVEGNPFYLEEVINALIDSGTLTRSNGGWRLIRPIVDSDVPSTIQGVISARLDRLENETKRILQEASVIGRAFFYEILKRITGLKEHIDRCLNSLERIDLIRRKSIEPDLEYVFKHALTHEVVYSGLLKKERQGIHEQIALVIERLFEKRLSDFYEALAFHFKEGQSLHNAVHYLVKSGEKSLNKYAVEESHQYFKEAFDLLTRKPDKTKEQGGLLIDLLIKWAFVFHYRGDFRGLMKLLTAHENLAKDLDDRARLGMYYALLGLALYEMGKIRDGYQYLCKALELGEEGKDQQVIGYACSWLAWNCTELGLLDEAVHFGKRGQEIFRLFESEDYLFFGSLSGMGLAHFYSGDRRNAFEAGKDLLDYGQRHSNIRSLVLGHFITGCSYLVAGDFQSAIGCFKRSIEVSADPWYCQFPRLLLGLSYVSGGQFQEAEHALKEVLDYGNQFGTELIRTPSRSLLGVVSVSKGHLSPGLEMLEDAQREYLESERRYAYAAGEHILGKFYAQIVEGAPISLSMVKNIGFLVRNAPFASRKAEHHFSKSIEVAKEIGAKGILGQAYLDLGLLHKGKGRTDQARECIFEAIRLFEQCEAEMCLKQAKEAMGSLA